MDIRRCRGRLPSLCLFLIVVMSLGLLPANAGVINTSNVTIGANSYRAFLDTTTGYTWLDLDNFFDSTTTYNSLVSLLSGSGFHLATLAELQALQASIPAVPANFASEVVIVGGNYAGSPYATGTRNLMWGIYEDGSPSDGISYAWKYDTDTSWHGSSNTLAATDTLRSLNPTNQDLGAWIVGTAAAVPEPGTTMLLVTGLAALAVLSPRGRWSKS